jgi:hypothetical protein
VLPGGWRFSLATEAQHLREDHIEARRQSATMIHFEIIAR